MASGQHVGQGHSGGEQHQADTGQQKNIVAQATIDVRVGHLGLVRERFVFPERVRFPGHGSYSRWQRLLVVFVLFATRMGASFESPVNLACYKRLIRRNITKA